MSNVLSPLLKQQFIGPTGAPISFGLLYTYQAGTTAPLATYNASGAANPNPVVLDAAGRADVWVPPNVAYKFNLTDYLGNQIAGFPVDNVVSSQLVTLYGGIDIGAANSYVLNFSASFSALGDGILIWWVPANTNTGASALNVNGLGSIAIVNPGGSALVAGQIVVNQPVACLYKGGNFILQLTGTSPLVLPSFKTLTAGTLMPDGAGNNWPVGYRDIPQNPQNSNYTTVLADAGKQVYHSDGTAYTWTIAANASVPYPVGTVLTFINDASAAVNITLAINSDTLVWTPSGATGTRTIAQFGRAVALKVTATRWWVSGTGLT